LNDGGCAGGAVGLTGGLRFEAVLALRIVGLCLFCVCPPWLGFEKWFSEG